MTSRLILDKLDLDLSTACLLVRLGLILVVILIGTTLVRSIVVDERVIADRPRQRRGMAIARSGVAWKVCALAFAHGGRRGGQVGLRGHRLHQADRARLNKSTLLAAGQEEEEHTVRARTRTGKAWIYGVWPEKELGGRAKREG